MSVIFHDGNHPLYRGYTQGKAWNDPGFLCLNEHDEWDKLLIDTWNHEAAIRPLFNNDGARAVQPYGAGTSRLSDWIDAPGEVGSIIVIKGLHQWEPKRGSRDFHLHLTFGFDGDLWHWYASYYNASGKIRLTAQVSDGGRVTGVSHDGFTLVRH